jgi:hypothetical protein
VNVQIDDLGRVCSSGGAQRINIKSTIALGLAAAVALISAPSADGAETTTVWSSSFGDSLWTTNGPVRSRGPSLPVLEWPPQCSVGCGVAFETFVVRRAEFLSSNTADVSVNKVVDSTGHAMGVSGMLVTERLDPGSLMDWVVVGERELDSSEIHSWSLLSPDMSLDADWLPIELYRFEDSSLTTDFAVGTPTGATPEASTWEMMLVGFAVLGVAGYGNSKKHRPLPSSCHTFGVPSDT